METPVNTARVVRATFRARNTVPFALVAGGGRGVLVPLRRVRAGAQHAGRRGPALCAPPCGSGSCAAARDRPSSSWSPWASSPRSRCGAAFPSSGRWARTSPGSRSISTAFYLAVAAVLGLTSARGAPAADRGLRLPRGGGCGGRLRVPGQGAAGRRDARAHLRPPGQPRRLLERARAHDGHGPVRGAGDRRRPQDRGGAAHARGRGRGADVLHLLLHASPAAAGSRSSSRSCSTSPSRPRAWRAS